MIHRGSCELCVAISGLLLVTSVQYACYGIYLFCTMKWLIDRLQGSGGVYGLKYLSVIEMLLSSNHTCSVNAF